MKRTKTKKLIAMACASIILALAFSSCAMTTVPDREQTPSLIVETEAEPSVTSTEAPTASTDTSDPPAPSESEPLSQTEEIKTAEPLTLFYDALTGSSVSLDPSGIRPVAVVVDNCESALSHQSGLARAGVLYETITAPGITRFLAVYSDYRTVPSVCNIRAGSAHDARIAAMYNAVVVSNGGHTDNNPEYDFFAAINELYGSPTMLVNTQRETAWSAQNAEEFGTVQYYESGYRPDLKYDTLLTSAALEYIAEQNKYSEFASAGGTLTGEAKNPIKISDAAFSGDAASGVTISFSASGVYSPLKKTVTMRYSLSDGAYLRFEDGRPHIDSESGEQLKFTNVIVLKTDIKYIQGNSDIDPLAADVAIYGSGTGYCFCGGKYTSIVWVCTKDGGLKLYDSAGELAVTKGNTYIAYVNKSDGDAVTIG